MKPTGLEWMGIVDMSDEPTPPIEHGCGCLFLLIVFILFLASLGLV